MQAPQPNPMTPADAVLRRQQLAERFGDGDATQASVSTLEQRSAESILPAPVKGTMATLQSETPDDEAPMIHRILRAATLDLDALEEEVAMARVNIRSPRGKTPLMTAAYYGHKAALELLVDRGAVVDAIHEKTGDTAAHFAVLSLTGHVRQCGCMMVLIEKGASIDMRNDDGYTVFELAKKNGNKDIGSTGDTLMHS
jgi:ankyrin repeat protein